MKSDAPCPSAALIEHVALATGDVECLRDFYRQLGPVASPLSTDPDTGARSGVLDFCGVRLELFERALGRERTPDDWFSGLVQLGFALGSADAVDEFSRALAAAGHRVLVPPHRAGELGSYECIVLDPDGNRLKLTV